MTSSPTSVLSVRVNAEERALLEEAADRAHTHLSDFVRRRALEAAEFESLSRSTVTIPAESWGAFEAWAKLPAKSNPGLKALAAHKPVWET